MVRIKAESNGEGLHRTMACKWDKVGDPKWSCCSDVTCKRRGKTGQRNRSVRCLSISAILGREGARSDQSFGCGQLHPRSNGGRYVSGQSAPRQHPGPFLNTPDAALFIGLSARTLESIAFMGPVPCIIK